MNRIFQLFFNCFGFYVDVSPILNKLIAQEAQRRIVSYLLEKRKARPRDMAKDLGFDVKDNLHHMITSGVVVREREGKKVFYSPNPNYRPS